MNNVVLIGGNSHPDLAEKIASHLGKRLSQRKLDQFSNTEVRAEIGENIRNKDIVIIQTGGSSNGKSVNDYLMETLVLIDACQRSNCRSIVLVMACFPYARQDKKDVSRTPISARLVAKMIEGAANRTPLRVVTLDLHASQIQGFFDCPQDNLWCAKYLAHEFQKRYLQEEGSRDKFVLVSPDAGGIKRLNHLAERLKLPTVIMHKERSYVEKNTVLKTLLIGGQDAVRGKICVIVDDMCDTGGTICKATQTLMENGSREVWVMVTHGILSGPAVTRLWEEKGLTKVIVTNSLNLTDQLSKLEYLKPYRVWRTASGGLMDSGNELELVEIDVSALLAETLRRIYTGGSISELFTGPGEALPEPPVKRQKLVMRGQ